MWCPSSPPPPSPSQPNRVELPLSHVPSVAHQQRQGYMGVAHETTMDAATCILSSRRDGREQVHRPKRFVLSSSRYTGVFVYTLHRSVWSATAFVHWIARGCTVGGGNDCATHGLESHLGRDLVIGGRGRGPTRARRSGINVVDQPKEGGWTRE